VFDAHLKEEKITQRRRGQRDFAEKKRKVRKNVIGNGTGTE
jgi:hypothetical protein